MSLAVGSRLGHYQVTALIGEGGMGQVYQATDTKLNRQVALKTLPEAFASDPDRLTRFQREAQVLASLNHPGIAALASGHLVVGGFDVADLNAVAFDVVNPAPSTADTSVLRNVFWYRNEPRSWFDASETGTLVYVPGDPAQREIVWLSRDGEVEPLGEGVGLYDGLALSRDGTRLAFSLAQDVWVRDLDRGTTTRLTFEGPDQQNTFLGAWVPGGDRIAFSANRTGNWELYTTAVDGTGSLDPLFEREFAQHVNSTSPDGTVAFSENNPETGTDLWTLRPGEEAVPFATSRFNEQQGRFSPDGRFMAYVSDESGQNEVYVRAYPGPGERVTVSTAGGIDPLWSPGGEELFYREADDLIAVAVRMSPTLTLGERSRLLDLSEFQVSGDINPALAISTDGQRFLLVRKSPGSRRHVNVILDWFSELERLIPTN